MERIWLKQYPPGVPADIDVTQYASLVELLEESFAKFADRKAFICMDKSISYRDLDEMSLALAAYLQGKGLQKGARVALMMPNVLQYPVSTAAVLRAGYAVVNVNPLYTPRELEHQLKDSGAEAIIVLENFATTVQQVIAKTAVKHVIVGSMGDMLGLKGMIVNLVVRRVKKMVPPYSIPGAVAFNDAVAAGRGMKFNKPKMAPDDVAFLQYTGGTTGVSKGATLLHRNILANVLQNDAWLQPALKKPPHVDQICHRLRAAALSHLRADGLLPAGDARRRRQSPDPQSARHAGLHQGAGEIPGQHLPGGQHALQRPVAHARLRQARLLQAENLERRRHGDATPGRREVAEEATGCALSEGYGLSETSPTLTCNPADIDEFNGSIGLPVPSTWISIRDDDGNEVPLGEPGEICAKGPQVMAGYWNRPDETAKVMTADGYFRTGDIGVMTRGRLHQDRRPQEGHDPGLGLQRLSQRDRGSDREPSRRAGMRRDRRARRALGRGGEGVRGEEGSRTSPPRTSSSSAATQLTGYKVPKQIEFRTEPAEDQCRQDPAPRTARREEGGGLSDIPWSRSRGIVAVIPGWSEGPDPECIEIPGSLRAPE